MITIYRSVLAQALYKAIKEQRKVEKEMGYTGDSGMVATWQLTLDELQRGGSIEFHRE